MSVRLVTLLWELRAMLVMLAEDARLNQETDREARLDDLVSRVDAELRDR